MTIKQDVNVSLTKARKFVFEGGNQIMAGRLDESHGVSPSPGATALATLALLSLGKSFETSQRRGSHWLRQQRQSSGWGKYPGDKPDAETTRLVQSVIQSSQGGWLGRITLLTQARQFSEMILSLGQRVVPGLEGPRAEEITLPRILEECVLTKLPPYGRPVVIAASLLVAGNGQEGVSQALKYLKDTQMSDGSWSEDIVATSLSILALVRLRSTTDKTERAGQWLVGKQYPSGAWPAFDQLQTWSIGWALTVLGSRNQEERKWLMRAAEWLRKGCNSDGSYGSTPPFTHPDLDDTAVALMGLQQSSGNEKTIQLLKRMQNEDGSWGTFPSFKGVPPEIECQFPVYITSTDVTIHVLEALWRHRARTQDVSIRHGLHWLLAQQEASGEVGSVWFEGPIYATAQTLELLSKWRFNWQEWKTTRPILIARKKAQDFLLTVQNDDGSWGSSIVETALALSAVERVDKRVPRELFDRGVERLLAWQKPNGSFEPSFRGIYAKGWNYEEPLATALTVIRAFERYLSE
ncbi:MAG: prenyltransferase/squalene oxidase repeat-containing protein [Desulfitobacteriaceae bacterium]